MGRHTTAKPGAPLVHNRHEGGKRNTAPSGYPALLSPRRDYSRGAGAKVRRTRQYPFDGAWPAQYKDVLVGTSFLFFVS
jgi:hypothetical protein